MGPGMEGFVLGESEGVSVPLDWEMVCHGLTSSISCLHRTLGRCADTMGI